MEQSHKASDETSLQAAPEILCIQDKTHIVSRARTPGPGSGLVQWPHFGRELNFASLQLFVPK